VVVVAAAAAALVVGRSRTVDAEALVIASRLDMSPTALSRYGQAVFDNGQVARAVAAVVGGDPADMVPGHISLGLEPGTVLLHVVGHASDLPTAEHVANVAAETYVRALNEPGVGVGEFVIQRPAGPSPGDTHSLATVLTVAPWAILAVLVGIVGLALRPLRRLPRGI
jgi:hypothetical protein